MAGLSSNQLKKLPAQGQKPFPASGQTRQLLVTKVSASLPHNLGHLLSSSLNIGQSRSIPVNFGQPFSLAGDFECTSEGFAFESVTEGEENFLGFLR